MTSVCILEPHATSMMQVKTHLSICSMLAYSSGRGIKLRQVVRTGSALSWARNHLAMAALESGCDYTLSIDSDMTFPPDALVRLLAHDKYITTALASTRFPPYRMIGRIVGPPVDGLVPVEDVGGAFMLVRTLVYKSMCKPWFFETYNPDKPGCMELDCDQNFIRKASEYGFETWADLALSCELGHIGEIIATLRPQDIELGAFESACA